MSFKKISIVLFALVVLFPTYNIFAQNSNTGFVSGNIWYSKDSLEEGDKVKIYTFIFNPDSRELSGTVLFFDKTVLLGKKEFIIPPRGAEDVSIDWTVTAGSHTIFGKIEGAKFLTSKGNHENASIAENETEKSSKIVSKKIISKEKDLGEIKDPILNSVSVLDITKIIEEKTPKFVSEAIASATDRLEEIRINIDAATKLKKEEVKKEIEMAKAEQDSTKENPEENSILQPFKHVELFLMSMFLLILENKIVFYGLLIIIILSLLRFILNKVFF